MTTLSGGAPGSTALRAPVLADLLPARVPAAVRNAALVAGGAALIGLAAQIAIPLPFTPVPITLQTLAVLLTGAALGPLRGAATGALYMLAGGLGVPWFTDAGSGWGGASFGYVVGFVLAAVLVGALARRRADRRVLTTVGAMLVGELGVYAVGVPWLMVSLHVSLTHALALGLTPFLVGDAVKIALAAGLLPSAWRLAHAGNASR